MTSCWTTVLSKAELLASYELTASLDPRFAREERDFYESRTPAELRSLMAQAWLCNEDCRYQKARSYLALREPVAA